MVQKVNGHGQKAPWTDIQTMSFQFHKHCNPSYAEVHTQLNKTYCSPIRNLDHLFQDGSARTSFKPGAEVLGAIRECIADVIKPLATATQDKTRICGLLEKMPLSARLSDSTITLLKTDEDVEDVFQNARDSSSSRVIVYLDIDALCFNAGTDASEFFDPRRFEDIAESSSLSSALVGTLEDEIMVPVINFLLIKYIDDDPDVEGGTRLVGSFVQHVYQDGDLPSFKKGELDDQFFPYTFNDFSKGDDYVAHRRTEHKTFTTASRGPCTLWRSTFHTRIPLETDFVVEAFPFKIKKVTATISLSTEFSHNQRIRPTLMVSRNDKRYNVAINELEKKTSHHHWCIKNSIDQRVKMSLDRMATYDFISPYPEICYEHDQRDGYCNKQTVSFYLVKSNGFGKLVSTLLPLALVSMLNYLNLENDWNIKIARDQAGISENTTASNATDASDESKYLEAETVEFENVNRLLGVSAQLALTVVFLFGNIYNPTGYQSTLFTPDVLYVMVIFISLILSSIPESFVDDEFFWRKVGGNLFWVSFIFPILNCCYICSIFLKKKPTKVEREMLLKDTTYQKWNNTNDDYEELFLKLQGEKIVGEDIGRKLKNYGYNMNDDDRICHVSYP